MKPTARIENWQLYFLKGVPVLFGHIAGHPRQEEFRAGQQRTSRVLKIDFELGIAETRNTVYMLSGDVGSGVVVEA